MIIYGFFAWWIVREDGQMCEREDENLQHADTYGRRMQRARQMQSGITARRNMRNFQPVCYLGILI